jgi:hypothetical protein
MESPMSCVPRSLTSGNVCQHCGEDRCCPPRDKKGIVRCLLDNVVVSRATRDVVRMRIVWRGGEATALDVPITVGSMADLSHGEEMERRIVKLARVGRSDQAIADKLTAEGFRSPMRPQGNPHHR